MDMARKKENYSLKELNPETRRKLEEAVLDVFSNTDFHRANMRVLAKKAGVSFDTIYKHYSNKEKLLFAVIDNFLGSLAERMIDHLNGIEDTKEKMRKIFWLQLDYYERNPNLGIILFMTIPHKKWMDDKTYLQKKMFNKLLEVVRQGQEEGILNQDVRAAVLIDFMWGLIQRSFQMWIYRGRKESLAGNSNTLFEMIWKSISKPKEKG